MLSEKPEKGSTETLTKGSRKTFTNVSYLTLASNKSQYLFDVLKEHSTLILRKDKFYEVDVFRQRENVIHHTKYGFISLT